MSRTAHDDSLSAIAAGIGAEDARIRELKRQVTFLQIQAGRIKAERDRARKVARGLGHLLDYGEGYLEELLVDDGA